MLSINTEIAKIKGLMPRFLQNLNKLGIKTVRDLLWHFPNRYEDFSTVLKIADLEANQTATIQGVVDKVAMRRTFRKHMVVVEATITDESGTITAIWFNQPYIAKVLRAGRLASFSGKVTFGDDGLYLSNPSYELISSFGAETQHTAGLIPIYGETKGLTSKGIRHLMNIVLANLETLPDFLPTEILEKDNFPDINAALRHIHSPNKLEDAHNARKRFSFEDLFLLQINNIKARLQLAQEKALGLVIDKNILEEIFKLLPFQLLPSQKESLYEILEDLGKSRPMNRLLQGDVGSGKTVVAAIAAIFTAKNGHQAAFMAPTEVLAQQHYKTLTKTFGHLHIPIGLLTSSMAKVFFDEGLETDFKKAELIAKIKKGEIKIIIGTHAIIQKSLEFDSLALTIIDEQHRFGVAQRRAMLERKKDFAPHFLSMSATPIPRTLMLTIFGDLDLSTITELPEGRKKVITKIVAPENRQKAYNFIREQIKKGRQAFIIYPRIEKATETENADGTKTLFDHLHWNEAKALKEEYEKLSRAIFPDFKLAMLHGKMKPFEKSTVMTDFVAKNFDILVTTSVIEVGVDIPNATIMVIEGAERFGLSQLYQFRGRVGRSEHQSFCMLFTDSKTETAEKRLKALIEAKNGFELAEKDLANRGPGEFLGNSQTGIPDMAMQSLNNLELVKAARLAAAQIIKKDQTFKNYPALKARFEMFQKKIHLE